MTTTQGSLKHPFHDHYSPPSYIAVRTPSPAVKVPTPFLAIAPLLAFTHTKTCLDQHHQHSSNNQHFNVPLHTFTKKSLLTTQNTVP